MESCRFVFLGLAYVTPHNVSSFIQVVAHVRIAFLSKAEECSIVWVHHILWICSSEGGHLGCLHLSATVNKAAMKTGVQIWEFLLILKIANFDDTNVRHCSKGFMDVISFNLHRNSMSQETLSLSHFTDEETEQQEGLPRSHQWSWDSQQIRLGPAPHPSPPPCCIASFFGEGRRRGPKKEEKNIYIFLCYLNNFIVIITFYIYFFNEAYLTLVWPI